MSDDEKVIEFRKAAPSARLKKFDGTEKHIGCKHKAVEIWAREPILECATCGVVVDAHQWIRDRVHDWSEAVSAIDWQKKAAQAELDDLKSRLRVLRKEYNSEIEKRRAEAALMVLPPQRGHYP